MAVKLSSYYWFRNNSLVSSLEDIHGARYWFGGGKQLSEEDKRTLRFIVKELDGLKEGSHFSGGSSIINLSQHVLIPNVVELKDITSNAELAAAYFEGIHGIMKQYWVKTDMYRQLGQCFDEIEVKPKSDTEKAVAYANQMINSKRFGTLESMCWDSIKEKQERDAKGHTTLRVYS